MIGRGETLARDRAALVLHYWDQTVADDVQLGGDDALDSMLGIEVFVGQAKLVDWVGFCVFYEKGLAGLSALLDHLEAFVFFAD